MYNSDNQTIKPTNKNLPQTTKKHLSKVLFFIYTLSPFI